jgi:hypothetical protein
MSELEERIEYLENENAALREFCETAAIGAEQLWELVCDHIDMPVPAGKDLRNII